jgi:hypothetical protein
MSHADARCGWEGGRAPLVVATSARWRTWTTTPTSIQPTTHRSAAPRRHALRPAAVCVRGQAMTSRATSGCSQAGSAAPGRCEPAPHGSGVGAATGVSPDPAPADPSVRLYALETRVISGVISVGSPSGRPGHDDRPPRAKAQTSRSCDGGEARGTTRTHVQPQERVDRAPF